MHPREALLIVCATAACASDRSPSAAKPIVDGPFAGALAYAVLPTVATQPMRLRAAKSRVAVEVTIDGVSAVALEGDAHHRIAPHTGPFGSDLEMRSDGVSIEDLLRFERPPPKSEVRYHVRFLGTAGLRLVSNVLEALDAQGMPRLRMAPPYLVDAKERRHDALVAIEGCVVDTDPRPPWLRPPKPPRADAREDVVCDVVVRWGAEASAPSAPPIEYPAILDPSWQWTRTMIAARTGPGAVAVGDGNTVLIVGGADAGGGAISSTELYRDGVFTVGPPMGVRRTSPMIAALPSGEVIVAGGHDRSVPTGAAESWSSATGVWKPVAALGTPRWSSTATVVAGRLVLTGGRQDAGAKSLADVDIWIGDRWERSAPLNLERREHAAAPLPSGKLLIVGGASDVAEESSAEIYDVAAKRSTTAKPMSVRRRNHTATALDDGRVVVAGGNGDEKAATTAEIFGGADWSLPLDMITPHAHHVAAPISRSAVLVAGGFWGPIGDTAMAEIVDVAKLRIVPVTAMSTPRVDSTATTLANGDVLVAGGSKSGSRTAELYRPGQAKEACKVDGDCRSLQCSRNECEAPPVEDAGVNDAGDPADGAPPARTNLYACAVRSTGAGAEAAYAFAALSMLFVLRRRGTGAVCPARVALACFRGGRRRT